MGTSAVLLSFGVAFVAGSLERLNANVWFGRATKELVDTILSELEAGRPDEVVRALKELQANYQPTYENRARYDELVRRTVERMKDAPATRPGP